MSIDTSSLPVSASVLLALAAYAGISLVGTGPLVAGRMIDKSGWQAACERVLDADIAARRPVPERIPEPPKVDCTGTLGTILPEMRDLCTLVDGLPVSDPNAAARDAARRAQERENRRLDRLAALSGTRCACAASAFAERERIAFALHAGSGRLIAPQATRDLETGLIGALTSAPCKGLAGGAS